MQGEELKTIKKKHQDEIDEITKKHKKEMKKSEYNFEQKMNESEQSMQKILAKKLREQEMKYRDKNDKAIKKLEENLQEANKLIVDLLDAQKRQDIVQDVKNNELDKDLDSHGQEEVKDNSKEVEDDIDDSKDDIDDVVKVSQGTGTIVLDAMHQCIRDTYHSVDIEKMLSDYFKGQYDIKDKTPPLFRQITDLYADPPLNNESSVSHELHKAVKAAIEKSNLENLAPNYKASGEVVYKTSAGPSITKTTTKNGKYKFRADGNFSGIITVKRKIDGVTYQGGDEDIIEFKDGKVVAIKCGTEGESKIDTACLKDYREQAQKNLKTYFKESSSKMQISDEEKSDVEDQEKVNAKNIANKLADQQKSVPPNNNARKNISSENRGR